MTTLVVVNPEAGGARDAASVLSTLRAHPALEGAEIRVGLEREDGARMAGEAGERGVQRILVAGGDGTVNGVVNGVGADAEVSIGVLPLGTGNDLARSLGVPLELNDALDALPDLAARRADLVRMGGSLDRLYVNASAGGFSGEVDEEVTPERKRSWGPLAYARSALELLARPPDYDVRLEFPGGEGERLRVLNLVVANGRTVAGGIRVAPTAKLDDGLLDVVLVRPAKLPRLAAFSAAVLVGKHLDHELVEHRRVARLELWSEPAMPFNLDGELLAHTPLTFQVLPGAVTLLTAAGDLPPFGAG